MMANADDTKIIHHVIGTVGMFIALLSLVLPSLRSMASECMITLVIVIMFTIILAYYDSDHTTCAWGVPNLQRWRRERDPRF